MATGLYDPNAIVPTTLNVTVGTSAVALKGSSSLSVKFTISNTAAANKTLYLGDSNVTATRGIPIAAGTSISFGETKMSRNESQSYDLGRFFLIATAASQVATLVTFSHGPSGGAF